ncbi:MAG TPA: histidine kinase N-terminal 7TM domain-containing protein, partial [Bacteroidia bacterium]|nr:histidine kinase N-terminal 7TM domain-containing protein [Bacteroidia bacterium]
MRDFFHLDFSHIGIVSLFFLPALINAGIFFYSWFFAPESKVNSSFSVLVLCLAGWQTAEGFVHVSATSGAADKWDTISGLMLTLSVAYGVLFSMRLCGLYDKIKRSIVRPAIFLPAIVIIFLQVEMPEIRTIHSSGSWNWVATPAGTPLSFGIYAWLCAGGLFMAGIFWTFAFRRSEDETRRKLFLLLGVGFAVPVLAGIVAEVLFPFFSGTDDVPITTSAVTAFSIASFIAMRRYRLLEYSPVHQWDTIVESMNEGMLIV